MMVSANWTRDRSSTCSSTLTFLLVPRPPHPPSPLFHPGEREVKEGRGSGFFCLSLSCTPLSPGGGEGAGDEGASVHSPRRGVNPPPERQPLFRPRRHWLFRELHHGSAARRP